MSQFRGPNLVYNNLILYYDPANTYSYVGAANTIYDLASNIYTGNLNNVSSVSNNLGVLSFNGTNSYISGSNFIGVGTSSNISINAWVYLNSLNTSCIFDSWTQTAGVTTYSTIQRVQAVSGTTTNIACNWWFIQLTGVPSTGNALIAYFGDHVSSGITSITQGGSNALWNSVGSTNNGTIFLSVWMLNPIPPNSNTTVTVYNSSQQNFWTGMVEEISGLATTVSFDVTTTKASTDPNFNTGYTTTTTIPYEYWSNIWYYYDAPGNSNGNEVIVNASNNYIPSTSIGNYWHPGDNQGNKAFPVFFQGMASAWTIVSSVGSAGGFATDVLTGGGNTGIPNFGWALTFKGTTIIVSGFTTNFGLVQKNGITFARTSLSDYNLNSSTLISTWSNICLVYSGAGASVYINGTFLASNVNANINYSTGITSFSIGSNGMNNNSELLSGTLGPISIYNISLTTSQVLQNFQAFGSRFGF